MRFFWQFPLSFKTANSHDFGSACIGWNHLKKGFWVN